MSIERILVPLDLIRDTTAARNVALGLAMRYDAELVLVHAYPQPGVGIVAVEPMYIPPGLLTRLDGEHAGEVAKKLNRIRDDLHFRSEGKVPVEQALRRGPVVEEIVAYAEETSADLIVMESRSSFGGSYLLGGIADKISHRAPCPVLVVPPDLETLSLARVLVAVDYSEFSLPSAQLACELADRGTIVELLHVWSPPYLSVLGLHLGGGGDPEARTALELERTAQADHLVEHAGKLAAVDGVRIESYIEVGSPVQCILERARESEADILVLGSHGHGSLTERVRGTVADRVLHNASIPVLLYPASALHRPPRRSDEGEPS